MLCYHCSVNERNGVDSYCKECRKIYMDNWNKAQPNYAESYRRINPYKGIKSERKRAHKLKYKYGLTMEEFNKLYEQQGGLCLLCGNPATDVDHIAGTKIIRGLLCGKCNRGIGLLNHDVNILEKAIIYLNPK